MAKLILTHEVSGLGTAGDIVDVPNEAAVGMLSAGVAIRVGSEPETATAPPAEEHAVTHRRGRRK